MGSRFARNAHLSDDKTVAKMGYPILSAGTGLWADATRVFVGNGDAGDFFGADNEFYDIETPMVGW